MKLNINSVNIEPLSKARLLPAVPDYSNKRDYISKSRHKITKNKKEAYNEYGQLAKSAEKLRNSTFHKTFAGKALSVILEIRTVQFSSIN